MVVQKEILLPEFRRGFHLITSHISSVLPKLPTTGILQIFIHHTSAGISINENADPSVRVDFENFINRLIPDNYSGFTHVLEGADDMPAHLKASIIGQAITIPIEDGKPKLGTWQGIYLCEFRNDGGRRKLTITALGE